VGVNSSTYYNNIFRSNAEIMLPAQNVIIHWEGMEIVASAIDKCDEESHQIQLLLINKATERVAVYMGNIDHPF
jgi:hypothetical protein